MRNAAVARTNSVQGWAVQGGVKVNTPSVAPGDALYLQGAYGDGAQFYTGYSAFSGSAGQSPATIQGQTEASQLGQIQVASFANAAGLQSAGDNYLTETAASGAANLGIAGQDGRGQIRQGMLEASNVNVVEELVDMIETQRAYEVNSKMISATDEMLKYVNQNL